MKLAQGGSATFEFEEECEAADRLPQSITLHTGWNWISFPHLTATTPLEGGMPSFAFMNMDYLKSQVGFTTYYEGFGWYGTLTTLEPYKCYMMKLAQGGSATFGSNRR